MKPFKTIEEQFELLKNRGMEFKDPYFAKGFLLRKNYYNTANVYGKYFVLDPGNENFKPGTLFEDIALMYDFEKNIRDYTFALIMNIEANVSSTISYFFSKKFNYEESYLDIRNYDLDCQTVLRNSWDTLEYHLLKPIKRARTQINVGNISRRDSISHYLIKYGNIPLWVLINEMSFGNVVALFRLLDINLKDEISLSFSKSLTKSYGHNVRITPTETIEYLNIITDFRNKVAHDSCLSIYRTPQGTHPRINLLNKNEYPAPNQSRTKFYDVLLLCRFFVSKSAYYSVLDKIIDEISILEKNLHDSSVMAGFMKNMGFNFYTF